MQRSAIEPMHFFFTLKNIAWISIESEKKENSKCDRCLLELCKIKLAKCTVNPFWNCCENIPCELFESANPPEQRTRRKYYVIAESANNVAIPSYTYKWYETTHIWQREYIATVWNGYDQTDFKRKCSLFENVVFQHLAIYEMYIFVTSAATQKNLHK